MTFHLVSIVRLFYFVLHSFSFASNLLIDRNKSPCSQWRWHSSTPQADPASANRRSPSTASACRFGLFYWQCPDIWCHCNLLLFSLTSSGSLLLLCLRWDSWRWFFPQPLSRFRWLQYLLAVSRADAQVSKFSRWSTDICLKNFVEEVAGSLNASLVEQRGQDI